MSRMIKHDPLKRGGCGDDKCMVCCSGGRGDCRKNGAGYRISCQECSQDGLVANYEGETGSNAYSRGLEHQNGLKHEEESIPLWKHCTIQHRLCDFKDPLVRQNYEGVRVKRSKADIVMNSKSEFHHTSIVRVVAIRGNINEEQTGAAPNQGRTLGGWSTMAGRSQAISPSVTHSFFGGTDF